MLFTLQAGRHRVVEFHHLEFKHKRVVVAAGSVKRGSRVVSLAQQASLEQHKQRVFIQKEETKLKRMKIFQGGVTGGNGGYVFSGERVENTGNYPPREPASPWKEQLWEDKGAF